MNTREKVNSGGYDHKLAYPKYNGRFQDSFRNPEYRAAKEAYNQEEIQIIMQFKADMEEEFDTQNWNRKEQAWNLAREEGHSNGFSGILNHYIDYVNAFFK